MDPAKRKIVRNCAPLALAFALCACDQQGGESESQIDPLGAIRAQQDETAQQNEAAQPVETTASTEAAQPAEAQEDQPVEAQEDQPAGAPAAGTFTPDTGEANGIWEDRMPAEAGRTILIPATTLFPGSAYVNHGIQNPYSGDTEAIAAGERHFAAYNCAGCHAPLGGGGMGPPLSDDEWIYGGQPAQIYLSIMHGRSDGMPAWASMLPRKTAWELVAYIETLSGIENYAAEAGFDENVGGFRQTGSDAQPGADTGTETEAEGEPAEPAAEAGSEDGE